MAIGFPPKFTSEISLSEYSNNEILVILIDAANSINCDVNYCSQQGIIAHTKNPYYQWNAEIKVIVHEHLVSVSSESVGSDLIDFGKNRKKVNEFIQAIERTFKSISRAELHAKYASLHLNITHDKQDILSMPPLSARDKFLDLVSIFIPKEGYFVTPILINLNILIFLIMIFLGVNFFSPDSASLIKWGANYKPMTLDGQWWRLFSCNFLHIGILHLLMNMFSLLYIGTMLEPIIGRMRFLVAYILTGLSASIASLWWNDITVSAGASGAIFGIYGVFLALLTSNLFEKKVKESLLGSIGLFVAYNLIYGMKGEVDNAAHIGGLGGGLVYGFSFIPSLKNSSNLNYKYLGIGLASLLIISISWVYYTQTPNNILVYEKTIERVQINERNALEIFNNPVTSEEKLLDNIEKIGIANWKENDLLLKNLKQMDLPQELDERIMKFQYYNQLRLNNFELIYKRINEQTSSYDSIIESGEKDIEKCIKSLNAEPQE